MLKIRDDVDLKELEKYGFKKQYDIDTGNLRQYKHKDFWIISTYIICTLISLGISILFVIALLKYILG